MLTTIRCDECGAEHLGPEHQIFPNSAVIEARELGWLCDDPYMKDRRDLCPKCVEARDDKSRSG